MKVLCLLALLYVCVDSVPVSEFKGKNWFVLVAGSSTWWNYRHQSNIYHAYQLIKANGHSDENIIVFHYDDIANNKQNKHPGQVFNNLTHIDVYHNVLKDFTGEDVTPENFLKVLSGDKDLENAGKKVLKSGPNDNVFVFFDDHGAPDLVCFPHKYLYSKQLIPVLKQMHQDNKFSKLVFYMEACESGSMFEKVLPTDINVYVTTAANAKESSWGTYVDETMGGVCLGGLYSVSWMRNVEMSTAENTLQDNYEYTKKVTNLSHVMQYGDLSIAQLPVSQFFGTQKSSSQLFARNDQLVYNVVDNRDSPLVMAQRSGDYKMLSQLSNGRQFLDKHLNKYFESIQHLLNGDVMTTRLDLNNRECYHKFVDTFNDQCFNIAENSYVLAKLYTFVNVCEQLNQDSATFALNKLVDYCQQNAINQYPIDIL